MSPNSKQDESYRRMTRGAAKIAKVRLPEYQDSSMVTWTWCLLCKGSKRHGFYTKSSLLRHYVKQHELVFFSDTLPKSMRELRANANYCSSCNFFVSDLTEHQATIHVPKSFRKYECTVCKDRFVLKYQLERHLKLHECRKRLAAVAKIKSVSAGVARMIKFYNMPLLTAGGLTQDYSANKTDPMSEFHMLTRTGLSYSDTSKLFVEFWKRMSWNRALLMYEKSGHPEWSGIDSCKLFMSSLLPEFVESKVSIDEAKLDAAKEVHGDDFDAMLKEMMEDHGLVILCASPTKVREILLAAEGLGLMDRGEYVFFNVELFASHDDQFYRPWYSPNASKAENERARRAYEAVLTVTARSSDTTAYSEFSQAVKTVSKEKFNYTYEEEVNTFVANFHDAVLLYAKALNESIQEHGLGVKSNGSYIVSKMRNSTIKGVTGTVYINDNGDRIADYALLDMDPEDGKFKDVAVYHGLNKSFEMKPGRKIHWPNRDKPPFDKPECGFDGRLCDEKSTLLYVLSTVFSVIVVALAIGVAFIYRYLLAKFGGRVQDGLSVRTRN